jgi:transcriptional regulator with XRE-family HTH domain
MYHKTKNMPKSIYSKEYRKVVERLKNARQEMGLKQIEVAKKFGKPQSFISKAERGERRLDVMELKQFADIYKKPLSYFL